jgi:hypothetical protein
LEIDCHQWDRDEDSRCIKDWKSNLVNDREIEVSIIFEDPTSLSQGEKYDFVIVKAWGYEKLAKLNIPLQVYSETKTA